MLDLHIATGNTPAHRLEQTNAGGFTAQTWDVAGNEANFFVRDVTGGSRLPFRIRPGAPTSSIDIAASGNVGIGTASPAARLTIQNTAGVNNSVTFNDSTGTFKAAFGIAGAANGIITGTAANDFAIRSATQKIFFSADNGTTAHVVIDTAGNVGIGTGAPNQKFSVNGDASKTGGNTWLAFSDERLKNIKGRFNTGLKAVMQLQPIRYEYKPDNALGLVSEGDHIGFGASAVQKIIPEAVTRSQSGYLMLNSDPILWTMLNAIKEQQKEIVELKGQIQKLQSASHRRGNKSRR